MMQQNTIGMRKIKHESPMSRLVDVTAEAENHLHLNLDAKTKYSQIGSSSKTNNDKPELELAAKGQTAPIFVMEIHPRALERRIKYEEVQQRREAFERERKRAIFAKEEKPVIRSIEIH